ncbi:hypothetical protein JI735_34105 (plasmid) [Paenibacillus sonchi]|uniref:Uncharacterized protein n=1 Tax=Paenibacillus sonchi TaxID=373687 RepID=A0A974PIT7_9BACL|nr:hypothetical protein [Paenibacillus sonchi]QQZ64475.1 hypothetical protein JI735_34105 [Paenibacillus sonchi]
MKTNCFCKTKEEDWTYDRELGCWYVIRTCDTCSYYWEGPDHTKTNLSVLPTKDTPRPVYNYNDPPVESLRERKGKYRIYCYDHLGNYGKPVRCDEFNDIFEFCELNKFSHSRINVVTTSDEICIQVKTGLYEFPPEWKMFNPQVTK